MLLPHFKISWEVVTFNWQFTDDPLKKKECEGESSMVQIRWRAVGQVRDSIALLRWILPAKGQWWDTHVYSLLGLSRPNLANFCRYVHWIKWVGDCENSLLLQRPLSYQITFDGCQIWEMACVQFCQDLIGKTCIRTLAAVSILPLVLVSLMRDGVFTSYLKNPNKLTIIRAWTPL